MNELGLYIFFAGVTGVVLFFCNYCYPSRVERKTSESKSLKKMKKNLLFIAFVSLSVTFLSCERSPFATTIEFQGQVFYGVISSTETNTIEVRGPLKDARVVLVGTSAETTTNEKGEYVLRVEVFRRFHTPAYENYTLEASGTSSSSYPTGKYISQRITVQGRPGDIIKVRDFLLYKHQEEVN